MNELIYLLSGGLIGVINAFTNAINDDLLFFFMLWGFHICFCFIIYTYLPEYYKKSEEAKGE